MSNRLGIIGGMGAAAGLALAEHVVRVAQASGARQDSDFPDFVLYNMPSYAMDNLGMTDQVRVCDQLWGAMRILTQCNCDVAVIACNTVQCFHDRLQQAFPATILVNSISAACAKVTKDGPVGVLCSQTAKHLELFEAELAKRNLLAVATTGVEQACLDEIIGAVIQGRQRLNDAQTIDNIMGLLAGRGAKSFILGCTELPLAFQHDKWGTHTPVIDAGKAAIEKALTLIGP